VAAGWRKLHNEELHNLYASPNIITMIKSMRMTRTGHVARMGELRNEYEILVGKPKRRRQFGRPRRRWEDYIKMDHEVTVRMWTGFILLGIGSSDRPL